MEPFVLLGWDGPHGPARRKLHRNAHLERLRLLQAENRVLLAGPMTDGAGSLLVIRFVNLNDAQAWLAADPYVIHGVFERTEVHPFLQVFPAS